MLEMTAYEFADVFAPAAEPDNKYDRLTDVLKSAAKYSETRDDVDDGGTCNFDSPAFDYVEHKMSRKKAETAIRSAGLRCFPWKCFRHTMLVITGFQNGQANRRTAMAEAFCKYMKSAGYSMGMYYQMD